MAKDFMWYCKDCMNTPEIVANVSLFICGDWYDDNTVCTHCGGSNLEKFDASIGCGLCPAKDRCVPNQGGTK